MLAPRPIAALACAAVAAAAVPAAAQSAITLYGGLRGGSGLQQSQPPNADIGMSSGFAGSVGIEWPAHAARPLQLLLSTQRTKLDLGGSGTPGSPNEMSLQVSYLQLGGLNFFEGRVGAGPYVAGGLGATFLSPKLPGTSSVVRPSLNVGIGYQWPLGPTLSLRTELRGYVTLINSSGAIFCSGGCVVQIRGDAMTQAEGMVGLSFGF